MNWIALQKLLDATALGSAVILKLLVKQRIRLKPQLPISDPVKVAQGAVRVCCRVHARNVHCLLRAVATCY